MQYCANLLRMRLDLDSRRPLTGSRGDLEGKVLLTSEKEEKDEGKVYGELLNIAQTKPVTAGSAAVLLEAWLGFRLRLEEAQVESYVQTLFALLDRAHQRCIHIGWLDPRDEADQD